MGKREEETKRRMKKQRKDEEEARPGLAAASEPQKHLPKRALREPAVE